MVSCLKRGDCCEVKVVVLLDMCCFPSADLALLGAHTTDALSRAIGSAIQDVVAITLDPAHPTIFPDIIALSLRRV